MLAQDKHVYICLLLPVKCLFCDLLVISCWPNPKGELPIPTTISSTDHNLAKVLKSEKYIEHDLPIHLH